MATSRERPPLKILCGCFMGLLRGHELEDSELHGAPGHDRHVTAFHAPCLKCKAERSGLTDRA